MMHYAAENDIDMVLLAGEGYPLKVIKREMGSPTIILVFLKSMVLLFFVLI